MRRSWRTSPRWKNRCSSLPKPPRDGKFAPSRPKRCFRPTNPNPRPPGTSPRRWRHARRRSPRFPRTRTAWKPDGGGRPDGFQSSDGQGPRRPTARQPPVAASPWLTRGKDASDGSAGDALGETGPRQWRLAAIHQASFVPAGNVIGQRRGDATLASRPMNRESGSGGGRCALGQQGHGRQRVADPSRSWRSGHWLLPELRLRGTELPGPIRWALSPKCRSRELACPRAHNGPRDMRCKAGQGPAPPVPAQGSTMSRAGCDRAHDRPRFLAATHQIERP